VSYPVFAWAVIGGFGDRNWISGSLPAVASHMEAAQQWPMAAGAIEHKLKPDNE
jgi:hypothetical protein